MVAGHLQAKKGHWYIVLTYRENGKPKSKWLSTGLRIANNKKKAEEMLVRARIKFGQNCDCESLTMIELLDQYMNHKKQQVKETTYQGYESMVRNHLRPYIESNPEVVSAVGKKYVQLYIDFLFAKNLSPKTVANNKELLSNIMNYAIRLEEISVNPVEEIENPSSSQIVENYFDAETMRRLLTTAIGSDMEFPIWMAAIYGLRRSEVAGLKWNAVDFNNSFFSVRHVVVRVKNQSKGRDSTKTDRSKNFPLISAVTKMLTKIRAKQQADGHYDPDGYIYLDSDGNVIDPNRITRDFSKFLADNGFRHIRFHDLRHSVASVLLSDDERAVSLKDIQAWLGHTDIKTTMRYAHILDSKTKKHTAEQVNNIFFRSSIQKSRELASEK